MARPKIIGRVKQATAAGGSPPPPGSSLNNPPQIPDAAESARRGVLDTKLNSAFNSLPLTEQAIFLQDKGLIIQRLNKDGANPTEGDLDLLVEKIEKKIIEIKKKTLKDTLQVKFDDLINSPGNNFNAIERGLFDIKKTNFDKELSSDTSVLAVLEPQVTAFISEIDTKKTEIVKTNLEKRALTDKLGIAFGVLEKYKGYISDFKSWGDDS